MLEFDALREPQLAAPYYLAAASYALWRGDVADASRSVERGWAVVRATEEWVLAARMAAMVAQVDAAIAAEAREQRQLAPLAAARVTHAPRSCGRPSRWSKRAAPRRRPGRAASPRRISRPPAGTSADWRATTTRPVWARVAKMWHALSAPYEVALARWRQAEATLSADGARARAAPLPRKPLLEAARLAARPRGAAAAARTCASWPAAPGSTLPEEVDELLAVPAPAAPVATASGLTAVPVGQADGAATQRPVRPRPDDRRRPDPGGHAGPTPSVSAGGSARSSVLVAQGRTNREIGERLFISQKTVGVHVGNILAKLEVSGRVEAAAVAIRLGLTDQPEARGVGARHGP